MPEPETRSAGDVSQWLGRMPLVDALLTRRSRRFAPGMRLDGGPLAYTSAATPSPLALDEEAALAFAAAGVTGPVLGELPFQPGDRPDSGGGNILVNFTGRTAPFGDGIQTSSLFVTNDDGVWLVRRPQDLARDEIATLIGLARERRFTDQYERMRVRISNRRAEVPREAPYTPTFNYWSSNQPGTTVLLPVAELTALYINVMLAAFSAEPGSMMLDERNRFQPAGVGRFAQKRGGHLHDDPASGRVGTIELAESWMIEFAAFEQGAMLQNAGLMAAALGIGGFVHFAAHPYGWPQALGFRMEQLPFSRTIGAGRAARLALRATGREISVPTALGLEVGGEALLKPYYPPYYPSMRAAVLAFIDHKLAAETGTLRDGGGLTAWRDGAAIQAEIPSYADETVEATIAYFEYLYNRYGLVPRNGGPFRTVLAYQAHRLDPAFYARHYREGALS